MEEYFVNINHKRFGIIKESIEVEENEQYMEEIIEYVDEIQSKNTITYENIHLASYLDLNYDIDITNKSVVLNRVKNYDIEL